ncbi:hypothetical protein COHA_006768 [Chlorella ohadii]|uniref:RRM domain-containing protein n=1 Tax=Chlorella ohadii TaxID=2649997 RepID=A0AAD5DM61_9CHLO|nr:hypothetical protein COHA_006768 [Chlorella ohadii]
MCRGTVAPDLTGADSTGLVLERLRQQLAGASGAGLCGADHLAHVAARGSGPRLFCGHVPPECSEELVKAHFSQWGHVVDVYFPKRKDTFRRRPFCFVTFNRLEDAQRALAESPMNICGIPIKQLNLVEDRADYYKHRHHAAQSALAPPAVDLGELAALLSLESAQNAQMNAAAARPQPFPMHQPMNMAGMNAYAEPSMAPRYSSGNLPPFANLPGFSQAGLTAQASTGMAMPAAQPAYMAAQPAFPPAFPPASAAALAAALAGPMGAAPRLPTGSSSPFSTLEPHASAASSPPKGELVGLPAGLPLVQPRSSLGSGSSGSASPDLDTAAANRLAMWQLQNELLADSVGAPADWPAAAPRLPATATVN